MDILLGSGAEINHKDHHGRTCLHVAASRCYLEGVDLLIRQGADANAADNLGRTYTYHACCSERKETLHVKRTGNG